MAFSLKSASRLNHTHTLIEELTGQDYWVDNVFTSRGMACLAWVYTQKRIPKREDAERLKALWEDCLQTFAFFWIQTEEEVACLIRYYLQHIDQEDLVPWEIEDEVFEWTFLTDTGTTRHDTLQQAHDRRQQIVEFLTNHPGMHTRAQITQGIGLPLQNNAVKQQLKTDLAFLGKAGRVSHTTKDRPGQRYPVHLYCLNKSVGN
jgi:hypothetical protein